MVTVAGIIAATWLSAATSAVASVSRAVVEETAPGARRLLAVLDHRLEYTNFLTLIRIIIQTTATITAGIAATRYLSSLGTTASIAIAVLAVTVATLIFVGLFRLSDSLKIARSIAGPLGLLGPVPRWLGSKLAFGLIDSSTTETELRELVDIAQEHGVMEKDESRMIHNVFDLSDTSARSVMVPRPEMIWIETDKTAGHATSLCVRSGHSRIPVIGESVDDILGVVYLKDLVQQTYYATDGGRSVRVQDVMRPAHFVPDSKNLDDLLREMQRERFHIAMLVDEYGGIAGLISIEDILEEIVGEIADEYDQREVAPIEALGDGRVRVVSRLSLDDLTEYLEDNGLDIEFTGDADTIGGFLALQLGKVPLPGSVLEYQGLTLISEGSRDRRGRMRVTSVIVEYPQPEQTED